MVFFLANMLSKVHSLVACWIRCLVHVFPDPGKLARAVLGRGLLEKCNSGHSSVPTSEPVRYAKFSIISIVSCRELLSTKKVIVKAKL